MSDWITANIPPKKDGRYLVTVELYEGTRIIDILSYAKDLYKVNNMDFYSLKGKSGWYDYDSEWGDCVVDGVTAWQKLPEVYGG